MSQKNEVQNPLDLRNVFPVNKIRTEIRKDEDIGKITKTAVDIVGKRSQLLFQIALYLTRMN